MNYGLMLGVFVGNFLIYALIDAFNKKPIDYSKGFWIGAIAAGLVGIATFLRATFL